MRVGYWIATQVGDDAHGVISLEHGDPPAASVTERNNAVWRPASGTLLQLSKSAGSTIADGALTADHNGSYNASGPVYEGEFGAAITAAKYTTTPGTGDVTANPNFVDTTRSFLSYGQSLIPALTTRKQVFDEFVKANTDNTFTTGFTIATYNTWQRAGYAPRAAQYHNAASDGTDIGAVAYQASGCLQMLTLQRLGDNG